MTNVIDSTSSGCGSSRLVNMVNIYNICRTAYCPEFKKKRVYVYSNLSTIMSYVLDGVGDIASK